MNKLFSICVLFLTLSSVAQALCDASQCVPAKCTRWDVITQCQRECGPKSRCSSAKMPGVASLSDANNKGQYEYLKLMNGIYAQRPGARVYFDRNCAKEGCKESSNAKADIAFALSEMRRGCSAILQAVEKIPGSDAYLGDLRENFGKFNSATSLSLAASTYTLKAFEPLNLNIKNCYNQGEAALYCLTTKKCPK